jgi:hypothetical protein
VERNFYIFTCSGIGRRASASSRQGRFYGLEPCGPVGLRIALTHGVISRPSFRRAEPGSASSSNGVSPSDELFFLLEGQVVEGRGSLWRVEVCGVYASDCQRWIQLNLCGPHTRGVTLRTALVEASDILDLLRDWLDDSLPTRLEPCIVSQASPPPPHSLFAGRPDSPRVTM